LNQKKLVGTKNSRVEGINKEGNKTYMQNTRMKILNATYTLPNLRKTSSSKTCYRKEEMKEKDSQKTPKTLML
jgi:hypothetical protein